MSFNIVSLVSDQLQGPLLNQVTHLLGDDSSKASAGMQSAIPALLSGLTGAAQAPGGADKLFNAVQDQDDGMLGNLTSMLGGSDASSVMDKGSSILSSLLGSGAMGGLGSVLGKFTGMSSGGTSSLLGMLAPIILGILKKKVLGDGLNAGGLASMLMGQKNNIMGAMPSGLSDQLNSASGFGDLTGKLRDMADGIQDSASAGLSSVGAGVSNVAAGAGNAAANVGNAASDAVGSAKSSSSGLMKFLIPLIAILVVAWLAMKFLGGGGADVATEKAADAAATVADVDTSALGNDLSGIFTSASETLGGVSDLESAKAAVPGLEELGGKVSGVAELFNKVPEAARGPLSSIASEGLGSLQPIIDKVMAIPGVGDLLKPVIEPILAALQGMAG